ncbi:MAG: GNAT family N-acetyltransferase [Candidatus Spyradocola sp.]
MLTLATPRLTIRPFAPEDEPDAVKYLTDIRTMRFIEPPFTPQKTRIFLQNCAFRPEPLVFAAEERATRTVVGHVIFHPYDECSWELGWVLRSDKCGLGYGKELGQAMLGEARRRGIPALVAETDPRNAASIALIRSLGFAYAGQCGDLLLYRHRLKPQNP